MTIVHVVGENITDLSGSNAVYPLFELNKWHTASMNQDLLSDFVAFGGIVLCGNNGSLEKGLNKNARFFFELPA